MHLRAAGSGGGIYNAAGSLRLINSTLSGNLAAGGTANAGNSIQQGSGYGGAVYNASGASLRATNTTISANTARRTNDFSGGGGIGQGGGIFTAGPASAATLANSIAASNSTSNNGPDLYGAFTSSGYNLVGQSDDSTGVTNGANGDKVGSSASPLSPRLGALANNGGPTQTMALSIISPALNAGSNTLAVDASNNTLTTDQRGAGYPRVLDSTVDVGAYEFACTSSNVVTNTADNGAGSLRYAVANTCPGGTISFSNTFYDGTQRTITLTSGELAPAGVTITGPGANLLTVSGNNTSRIFEIVNGETVSISGLTLSNGVATQGGAILNAGTLTLAAVSLSNNTASGANGADGADGSTAQFGFFSFPPTSGASGGAAQGGAIYNTGALTVSNSTLSSNAATGGRGGKGGNGIAGDGFFTSSSGGANGGNGGLAAGAGIYSSGSVTIVNCTLSGNTAIGGAGGTYGGPGNSGLSGGTGGPGGIGQGGGLFVANGGTLISINTTVSNNSALGASGGGGDGSGANGSPSSGQGGGVQNAGTAKPQNTIIAGNAVSGANAQGPDVFGAFTSQGFNLIGKSDNSTGFSNGTNGDKVGSVASLLDPKLTSLASNGGPTQTMALDVGSPAIDAGNNTLAVDANSQALTTDQRGSGFPRMLKGNAASAGAIVDIGSYERAAVPATPTITPGGPTTFCQGAA